MISAKVNSVHNFVKTLASPPQQMDIYFYSNSIVPICIYLDVVASFQMQLQKENE